MSLRGMLRAACGRGSGLRGRASALRGGRKCSARACRCAGASGGLRRGMGGEVGGRASRSLRACVGAAGASGSLRRGMGCGVGGEWIAQPAGVRRGRVGEQKCSGRACRCAGASEGLRRRMGCEGCGECIAQPAGVRRHCVGERKCSGRACRCVGARGSLRRGMGGEVGGFNAHSPQQVARTRIIIYRPPCPRREIAAMGRNTPSASTHSPPKTSTPAPSAFALPCPRSHFPRIAFGDARGAIGIPQQQLSTMGYPRKSYPHRCSPPCAKRSRPRACARVYIIYRSPIGRSRGVSAPLRKRVRAVGAPCPAPPCAGWGRAKAKADAPSRSAEPCRLCAESLCAKAEVHKANPAPARALSPRQPVYTRAPAR